VYAWPYSGGTAYADTGMAGCIRATETTAVRAHHRYIGIVWASVVNNTREMPQRRHAEFADNRASMNVAAFLLVESGHLELKQKPTYRQSSLLNIVLDRLVRLCYTCIY
jgi:hypothetical protein